MKKLIIFLFFAATFVMNAQSINVELNLYGKNAVPLVGQSLGFYDDNNDGYYERLTKTFSDKSYQDWQVESNYQGALDKNCIAIILQGNLSDTNIYVQIDSKDRSIVAVLLWAEYKQKYILAFPDKIVDPNETNIQVTPNPAKDLIEFSYSGSDSYNFSVADEQGKNITDKVVIVMDYNQKMKLDISGLIQGVYFIKIGQQVGKFIKVN